MIASVKFIMNGANHLTDTISSYPFSIWNGWQEAMKGKNFQIKYVVGNDV
jgi:virginiamycin A acetyltransferase